MFERLRDSGSTASQTRPSLSWRRAGSIEIGKDHGNNGFDSQDWNREDMRLVFRWIHNQQTESTQCNLIDSSAMLLSEITINTQMTFQYTHLVHQIDRLLFARQLAALIYYVCVPRLETVKNAIIERTLLWWRESPKLKWIIQTTDINVLHARPVIENFYNFFSLLLRLLWARWEMMCISCPFITAMILIELTKILTPSGDSQTHNDQQRQKYVTGHFSWLLNYTIH